LAKRLGISRPRLNKLLNDPEWRWGRGPWTEAQAAQAESWLEERRREANRTRGRYEEPAADDLTETDIDPVTAIKRMGPERQARTRVLIERYATLKLDREMKLGLYVLRADVQQEQVKRVLSVKAELQNIEQLVWRLEGRSADDMRVALKDWAKGVCDKFAGEHGN
jgi:hypothetical protein